MIQRMILIKKTDGAVLENVNEVYPIQTIGNRPPENNRAGKSTAEPLGKKGE